MKKCAYHHNVHIRLYQIFLKSTVYEISSVLHWTNGPGKVWTRETVFVKKNGRNFGNFATVAVKLTS